MVTDRYHLLPALHIFKKFEKTHNIFLVAKCESENVKIRLVRLRREWEETIQVAHK